MIPYSLQCTTCRAALRVTDASAIGQILACPKCGSMVQVVPPLEIEQAAVRSGIAVQPAGMPASSERARPGVQDIEQLAAAGTSLLPDDARAMPATPPPLPRVAITAEVDPIVAAGKPITFFIAAAAGSILAVGVIVWAVWSYLRDDALPAVAETLHRPAHTEQEPTKTPPILADDVGSSVPEEPAVARSPQANSETEPSEAEPSESRPAAEKPTNEFVGGSNAPGVDVAGDRPADIGDATSGDSEAPLVTPVDPTHAAGAKNEASNARAARKSALKLEDLPRSDLPDGVPVVTESAGQQAAEGALAEPSSDPVVSHELPNEKIGPDAPAERPQPPPRRIVSNKVDVPRRLATTIAAIDFRDVPLHKALEALSELGGVPIGLDVDALRAAGVRVDRPISVQGKSLTIDDALEHALGPLALVAQEQNGHLRVMPATAGQTRKARYAVDDLARAGDPPIEDLVELVRAVVAGPAIEGGSEIGVSAENGAIFLTAREVEHDRMIELCEKLRVARGRPLRTRFNASRPDPRFDPRRFELSTRWAKAQDMLAGPVTVAVGRPALLCDVVKFLAEQTGATILIDRAALSAAGREVEADARLVASGEPFEAALGRLLAPLGLAFRVVDNKLLEISTADAIGTRVGIEFYPARGMFAGRSPAAGDIELHRDKLLAAAGIASSKAAIVFDAPSECFIVCAAYPEQVRLEQAMRKLGQQ